MMTFFTFVAPLAAIGLVCGDMENALDCCVVGNISANSWSADHHSGATHYDGHAALSKMPE